MQWLAFGTYDVDKHPRVGVLIDGLRAAGETISELNAPLPLDTAARVQLLRQPWRLPGLAWKLGGCWVRLLRGSRRASMTPEPDVVLVGYLGHFDVRLARRLFPRSCIVLDHLVSAAETGHDRGLVGRNGTKERLLRWIDARALDSADVVVVDTPERQSRLPAHVRERSVVVPVGAESDWFTLETPARTEDGMLRVIFFGLFTPLQGALVIGEALARLAEDRRIRATMVGSGQDLAATRLAAAGNPNVEWVEWVARNELPTLVASHDVSLGIFGTTRKALQVVPTKVFQSAAAGRAVLTSDTRPQRLMWEDALIYVPPGDADALADALRDLARDPHRVSWHQEAARTHARELFMPSMVVEPLLQHLSRRRVPGQPTASA